MTSHDWPPLRLGTEKVALMRKTGTTSTIILAALLAAGCVTPYKASQAQTTPRMPEAAAQKITFDCMVRQDPEFTRALGYNMPYCMAGADLDRNTKTSEVIIITPGAGGSGGDPLAIFQKAGKANWARIDNEAQYAFFDGVAIKTAPSGWSGIVTNYGNGRPENVMTYRGGKYQPAP